MRTLDLTEFEAEQVENAITHILSHNYVWCECDEEWCQNERLQYCPACTLNRVLEMLSEEE